MSDRAMWKMLHLLYPHREASLTTEELVDVGVDCYQDTIAHLVETGTVVVEANRYRLDYASRTLLQVCLLARRTGGLDIQVYYPHAFIVMPFGEPWSSKAYKPKRAPIWLPACREYWAPMAARPQVSLAYESFTLSSKPPFDE